MRLNDERVVWQEADGEAVALDLVSSTYLSVNASGTLLLRALSTGASEAVLVARLVNEYDLCEQQARADVREFIDALEAKGLLAVDPNQPLVC